MGIIKCTNCGADINENSSFCGECGHKVERTENKDVEPEKLNDTITTDNGHKNTDSTEKKDAELKVPFYLSGWFIFLMAFIASFFTLGITYIVAIVLACIRRSKFKDKKLNNNLILGSLIAPIALEIISFVVLTISTIKEDRQINKYIELGQYEEAANYITEKDGMGTGSYVRNMLKIYEAQDDYDGAALFILDEIASDDLLTINSNYIDKLKTYVKLTSDDVTEKINDKLSDIEEAKKAKEEADEKAKKDVKEKETEAKNVEKETIKETKKSDVAQDVSYEEMYRFLDEKGYDTYYIPNDDCLVAMYHYMYQLDNCGVKMSDMMKDSKFVYEMPSFKYVYNCVDTSPVYSFINDSVLDDLKKYYPERAEKIQKDAREAFLSNRQYFQIDSIYSNSIKTKEGINREHLMYDLNMMHYYPEKYDSLDIDTYNPKPQLLSMDNIGKLMNLQGRVTSVDNSNKSISIYPESKEIAPYVYVDVSMLEDESQLTTMGDYISISVVIIGYTNSNEPVAVAVTGNK